MRLGNPLRQRGTEFRVYLAHGPSLTQRVPIKSTIRKLVVCLRAYHEAGIHSCKITNFRLPSIPLRDFVRCSDTDSGAAFIGSKKARAQPLDNSI